MSEVLTNRDAYDRLDQSHSAFIQKMFWIACSSESEELKELLDDLSPKNWATLYPDIKPVELHESVDNDNNGDCYVKLIIAKRKLGLLAECRIPSHYNFSFDNNGDFKACSVSYGRQTIFFAYGETREELLQAIEKQAEEIFQEQVQREKVS